MYVCICISYNTARVLCLIYTHDAQGHAVPKGECIYISQSTSAWVITNMLHFRHSKNLPKPLRKMFSWLI